MKTALLSALMSIGIAATAFAAAPTTAPAAASNPGYTPAETKQLSYCMWLSSAAYVIAGYKLHGDPASTPKKFYLSDPQSPVLSKLVDTIYADQVTDAWNYAGDFYRDCAENVAQVPPQRSGPSGACMHATLVAATARTARANGEAKAKVDALYASKGPMAEKIINQIYAPKEPPAQGTELQTWSDCMAAFSKP
ncbi:MAG TPA: hypothetical protein VGM16_00585 [Gammaproteobacteria bacterium]